MRIEILKEIKIYSDDPRELHDLKIGVIELKDHFAEELLNLGYAKRIEKALEASPENKMFDGKNTNKKNKE